MGAWGDGRQLAAAAAVLRQPHALAAPQRRHHGTSACHGSSRIQTWSDYIERCSSTPSSMTSGLAAPRARARPPLAGSGAGARRRSCRRRPARRTQRRPVQPAQAPRRAPRRPRRAAWRAPCACFGARAPDMRAASPAPPPASWRLRRLAGSTGFFQKILLAGWPGSRQSVCNEQSCDPWKLLGASLLVSSCVLEMCRERARPRLGAGVGARSEHFIIIRLAWAAQ